MSENHSSGEHMRANEEASRELLVQIRDQVEALAVRYGTPPPIHEDVLMVDIDLGVRPVLEEKPIIEYRATEAQMAHIREGISGVAGLWWADVSVLTLCADLPYYLNTDAGSSTPAIEYIVEEDYLKTSDIIVAKGGSLEAFWVYSFGFNDGSHTQFSKNDGADTRILINPQETRIPTQDAYVIEDILNFLAMDCASRQTGA